MFKPFEVTEASIRQGVRERCERLQTETVDLLQFHWQNVSTVLSCPLYDSKFVVQYSDLQYLRAMEILNQMRLEGTIRAIGLCNF